MVSKFEISFYYYLGPSRAVPWPGFPLYPGLRMQRKTRWIASLRAANPLDAASILCSSLAKRPG